MSPVVTLENGYSYRTHPSTWAKRFAPFGHSVSSRAELCHEVQSVRLDWCDGTVQRAVVSWKCNGTTHQARLVHSLDDSPFPLCQICATSDETPSVYFVQRDDLIKIGRSRNPQRRARSLDADVLATLPGGSRLEREMHKRFADARASGEWFYPTPELLAFISGIQSERAA